MKRLSMRLLICLLFLVSAITLLNIVIMYWLPIILPFSSFIAIRLVALAFIEKMYWLIIISFFICILMFIVISSIHKKRIFYPMLFSLYLVFDIIVLFPLWWESISTKYSFGWFYFTEILINIVIYALICVYLVKTIRGRKHKGTVLCVDNSSDKTGDGSLSSK